MPSHRLIKYGLMNSAACMAISVSADIPIMIAENKGTTATFLRGNRSARHLSDAISKEIILMATPTANSDQLVDFTSLSKTPHSAFLKHKNRNIGRASCRERV